MLFSSLVFLFCFLPFSIIGYFILPKSFRNYFLLIISLFFYGWGGLRYLCVMLAVIIVNYVSGFLFGKIRYQKITLWVCIFVNLAVLGYYKYTDFFIANANDLFNLNMALKDITLPIGISFYIFQSLSYVIDVYCQRVAVQTNLWKFALYVSMFPQLVAGPIVRYSNIEKQLDNREVTIQKATDGLRRFIIGLAKKVILANTLGEVADKVYGSGVNEITLSVAWLGAISYSLQIFYDFSGYSDMAIGLGKIFGFNFLENFNYPYIANSISEFWRRWHISLSSWFKEYVYIPLGGNKVSKNRNILNLLIVFAVTGLWHGASWNFVIWGLWHGFFVILEKWHKFEQKYLWQKVLSHLYVILVFVIGWVFFRAENLTDAIQYICVMFGIKTNLVIGFDFEYYFTLKTAIFGLIAIMFCYPFKSLNVNKTSLIVVKDIILLNLLLYSVASIAASGFNPFIYFKF